jgi:peptidylprolyl isomerase
VSPVRRLLIAPALLFAVLAVLLSACGSSPSSSSGTTTTASTAGPGTTTTAAAPGTTTSTTAPSTTTTTTTTATSDTSVPAVADPTNLTVAPVVSPGTPPPPTKLVTKDLVVGTGATATASSTVVVKYVGADYTTGKDFTANTWTNNQTATFPLSEVVPGFSQGIVGMKVGGRREIVIPPALGYGAQGSSSVQPNETLVFIVDLKSLK